MPHIDKRIQVNKIIESQLPEFYADNSNRPKLMEISTPNVLNDQVLKSFFNKAKK